MYCKLRNDDVVRHFVYRLEAARNHGRTLRCEGVKLFSYDTCIAQWNYRKCIINDTEYGATSTRIRNYVRKHLQHRYGGELSSINLDDVIVPVTGVPKGCQDLLEYLPED